MKYTPFFNFIVFKKSHFFIKLIVKENWKGRKSAFLVSTSVISLGQDSSAFHIPQPKCRTTNAEVPLLLQSISKGQVGFWLTGTSGIPATIQGPSM